MNAIAAFALLSLVLTVTPGPDGLLVLHSSLRAGRRTGIRVAAGATSGSSPDRGLPRDPTTPPARKGALP
jgi:threonine/homoserine/homoserine lactone efflux protein